MAQRALPTSQESPRGLTIESLLTGACTRPHTLVRSSRYPHQTKAKKVPDGFRPVRDRSREVPRWGVKPAANKNEWVGLLTALTAAEQASNDMTLRLRPGS
jgi:hypothetical protein